MLPSARWPWVLALSLGACAADSLISIDTKTDEFTQNVAADIDVLWVIDNSESMAQEQQGLGESFQVFIDTLLVSNVDYHIGVISTDPADEGLLHIGPGSVAVINPETPNPADAFLDNVRVGTSGARAEKAFETAALAMGVGMGWKSGDEVTPPNSNFLRDEAALFIIMVSDEEDNSFGPVDYYRRLFESYKGPGNENRISMSAIVGPPGDPDGCFSPERGSAVGGYRYVDLAGQTGGIYASICDDFNESLANLSITAAGLKSIFELSSYPNLRGQVKCDTQDAAELCVRINGTAIRKGGASGWSYDPDLNAVVFGALAVPAPEARILVEYQEGGK